MIVAVVTGSFWATKKCEALRGQIFLEVAFDGKRAVAADMVGAGVGAHVLVAMGSAARAADPALPCDAAIVAILDERP